MSIFFPRHDEPDPDVLEGIMFDELDATRALLWQLRYMLVAPVSLTDARKAHAMLGELIGRWEGVEKLREARG